MNAQRQFNITGATIKKSMEKLSSGYKINRAADDAAGLTISEKMRSLIRGMNQGSDNIQDGISVMQIADGALAEVHGMLHRMTELSIKSANGTNTAADRAAIQQEINQLSAEITRIGKTTTFNTLHILDNGEPELIEDGSVTQLVGCKSAEKITNGRSYMAEAYEDPDGNYHPAAILDFTNLNKSKIKALDGKGFSFVCGFGCGETFKFTFDDSTTEDTLDKNTQGGTHNYTIGTKDLTNGSQIADALMNAVKVHYIQGYSGEKFGGRFVSHRSFIAKVGDGKLAVFQEDALATEALAKVKYPKPGTTTEGSIDCSEITGMSDADEWTNEFRIQCSNIVDDCEYIETYKMNAQVLGVDGLNVSTQEAARTAIGKIEKALAKVSEQRSAYGAFQNRLEHSYENNNNKVENTQAAESRIRDTDMAKEMVTFTAANILSQAGSAMLSQTMQNPQSILQLLS